MKIKINDIVTEVKAGTTVMNAARGLGFEVPSMCWVEGHSNHPSCMICMVKDRSTGKMFPSCAMLVSEGMDIVTDSAEVKETRKEALELLLSDHLGDCEAPCRLSCPAFMNIPLMNRLIAKGDTALALSIIREEIAIPLVLGYICPAPCEKACHRGTIDRPVAICSLKKYAAQDPSFLDKVEPLPIRKNKHVAIIGTGPSGLSAAFCLLKDGYDCTLYDKADKPGGALRKISPERLPPEAIELEIEVIRRLGGKFICGYEFSKESLTDMQNFNAIILAPGYSPEFPAYDLPENCFICGNPEKEEKMAVRSAAKGKAVAMDVAGFLSSSDIILRKRQKNISRIGKLDFADQAEYLKECVTPQTKLSETEEAARCMHCDCRKADECKLRIYSETYGAGRRFSNESRKAIVKEVQHDLVIYEPQKCIRCGLCVEISSQDPSSEGMAFFGRGYDVVIGFALGATLKEALNKTAEQCVEACPTGALSFKEDKK